MKTSSHLPLPSTPVPPPVPGNPRPTIVIPSKPRTVFPGWASGETVRTETGEDTRELRDAGHLPGPGRALRLSRRAAGLKPRLLAVGAQEGIFSVLTKHLDHQGDWDIHCEPSLPEARAQLSTTAPDLILAVWSDGHDLRSLVSAIRRQMNGYHLPVIIAGCPPPDGITTPFQPVRGVLCLPRPLKWRTLLLCLNEHLRACRRRAS